MKVDTESAMLEMDQILRANELTISLVAAVPAILVAGTALYGLGRWAALVGRPRCWAGCALGRPCSVGSARSVGYGDGGGLYEGFCGASSGRLRRDMCAQRLVLLPGPCGASG